MDQSIERWLPVPGYEGLYEVSDHGRVRSLRARVLLKPWRLRTGYLQVHLYRGGAKAKAVHRLVLMAFVGPPGDARVAAHGDGDRANNRLDNLRWTSQSDNMADAREHGTLLRGEDHPQARLTQETADWIRSNYVLGKGVKMAAALGIGQSTLSRIITGQSWPPAPSQSGLRPAPTPKSE